MISRARAIRRIGIGSATTRTVLVAGGEPARRPDSGRCNTYSGRPSRSDTKTTQRVRPLRNQCRRLLQHPCHRVLSLSGDENFSVLRPLRCRAGRGHLNVLLSSAILASPNSLRSPGHPPGPPRANAIEYDWTRRDSRSDGKTASSLREKRTNHPGRGHGRGRPAGKPARHHPLGIHPCTAGTINSRVNMSVGGVKCGYSASGGPELGLEVWLLIEEAGDCRL